MFSRLKIKPLTKLNCLDILLVIILGTLLCYMGFYNGYPLVFSDDGTYLASAFGNLVPIDRPVIYGYFLRHISLMTSLWLVIWCQGLLLSLLFYYCFRYLSGSEKFRIYYIIFIFLITFLTCASINVSQLIPDVFTSMTILCILLLVFAPGMKKRDSAITSLIFVLSLGVHNSHFVIAAALLLILVILYVIKPLRRGLAVFPVRLGRIIIVAALVIFSNLAVSTINYSKGRPFNVSNVGHVMFMARLIDMGLVQQYLDENCNNHNYKFCQYKDVMPWNLMWAADGPLYKTGGWDANKQEYWQIIRDMLSTPKYATRFAARSAEGTFRQFFTFEAGDSEAQKEGSGTMDMILKHWPENTREYVCSRQYTKTLEFSFFNNYQKYLVAFSLCLCMLVFFIPGIPGKFKWMILFIVLALLVNAFVCSVFSGIVPRYQSRVIWLLPLPLMLYLANLDLFSFRFRRNPPG
jgi:hypothetical protein